MNQLTGEPYRFFVIRILEKWMFILIFVLRQKTTLLLRELLIEPQFRLHARRDHAREMPC